MSDFLRPYESQHARPPCPSPSPGVHSNSCSSSRWCHPAISSSVVPFSSCPQSLPASESFPMSQFFAWGGQSTGVIFPNYKNKQIGGQWCILYPASRASRYLEGSPVGHPNPTCGALLLCLVQFSCSVVSDSLWPHDPQHARPPCPSPSPGVHSNTSIELVMPASHLSLCRPLFLLPPSSQQNTENTLA